MRYPIYPGAQPTDTSVRAAKDMAPRASTVRSQVLACLEDHGSMTSEEVAQALDLPRGTVQPRITELRRMGRVIDTGERRLNDSSGKPAIVWAAHDGDSIDQPTRSEQMEAEIRQLKQRLAELEDSSRQEYKRGLADALKICTLWGDHLAAHHIRQLMEGE